jgi:hypothetical protein
MNDPMYPYPRPSWWDRHKGQVLGTVAAVAITVVVVQRVGLNQHNRFLDKKGLLEEFYDN